MEIEIVVPDSLKEITLEQYQRFLKIQANNEDETFLAIKMIEIFCKVRGDVIMKMKASDIRDITGILAEMFNQKPPLVKHFDMKGIKYGFIPKLEDMTFGEYVDLDTYISDIENIHKAMAVLYRPVTTQYNELYSIEEYDGENYNKMKDMPMHAVLSSIIFFYNLGMDLSKAMLDYLHQEGDKDIVQRITSVKDGDGTNQFTHSLKEILEDLKISLN